MNSLSASDLTRPARYRGMVAAISCISLVGIALALMMPLLSLELERRGVSAAVIGLQTAAQASASVLSAFLVPRLIQLCGPRLLLIATIVVSAIDVIAFPLMPETWMWFPLRFILGACLTVLFIVSEYWITGVADEKRRGIAMGVYATFLSLGFAAGPAILSILGTAGFLPYLTGATIFLLGLIPVVIGGGAVPLHDKDDTATPLWRIIRAAPVAVLAGFFFGAIESSGFSFLPIWGERIGLSDTHAALLLTVSGLGNVAFQIPLGLLSDRVNRRRLILFCSAICATGALYAPGIANNPMALFVGVFIWSGMFGAIYPIGLAQLSERFRGPDLAAANSAFILNYSLGMFLAPPLTGLAMERFNPHGFLYALSVLSGGYALIIILRWAQRSLFDGTPRS